MESTSSTKRIVSSNTDLSRPKLYTAAIVVWAITNTAIKVSVLHFYITIFGSNKTFLRTTYGVIILVVAYAFALIICGILHCRQLRQLSNACDDSAESQFTFIALNVATDTLIVLLPMPLVWGLKMATRRKIELTLIFALGFLYVHQGLRS